MHLLPVIAIPAIIHIAGVAVPAKAFKDLPSATIDMIGASKRGELTPLRAAKDLLPIVFSVAGVTSPIAGAAIGFGIFIYTHSKPPTPEDQQRMWDKAQGIP